MSAYVHTALDRFQDARSGARRFHREAIGDCDPSYCLADFLDRVRKHDRAGIEKSYGVGYTTKAVMSESQGQTGGYLLPAEIATPMLRDISEKSVWRRYGAYVQPMKSLTCQLPVPDISTAQAANVPPWFGGFTMSYLSQSGTQTLAAQSMAFRNVTLTAWVLAGTLLASNPFLEDAEGVESWLRNLMAGSVAWNQDLGFFQGSGVGQPMGVGNAPGAVAVSRGAGFTATIAQSMLDNLLPSAWQTGAVWFCHPTVLPTITAFTGWAPNIDSLHLYGLPIIPTSQMATSGSRGDVILAAPPYYIIGDRMQVEVSLASEEPTAWKQNSSQFMVLSRFDGQPMLSTPATLPDGSTQSSPFVVLV